MRRWLRGAGVLIALVLVGYFLWFSCRNLDGRSIAAALASPWTGLALSLAAIAHMAVYPLTGLAWRSLLLRQQQDWRAGRLARIVSLTQLSKYVPGNVLQHASRAALALEYGMPLRPYVSTVVQETLLACAASLLVGIPLVAYARIGALMGYEWVLGVLFVGSVALVAAFCINVPLDGVASTETRTNRVLRSVGGLPGPRATLSALSIYVANYLLIGLGIWLIARALGMAEGVGYALATSAFALSWILGFLAPGAPAGIGAREGIMILILHGQATDMQIAQLVLLARLASMLADLISFCVAAWWPRIATTNL